jgi:hypothetical protein
MDRACSRLGSEGDCIRGLVGKPEGKRPLGRSRRRWEDDIKMNIRKIKWGGFVWFRIAMEGFCESSGTIKYWDIFE